MRIEDSDAIQWVGWHWHEKTLKYNSFGKYGILPKRQAWVKLALQNYMKLSLSPINHFLFGIGKKLGAVRWSALSDRRRGSYIYIGYFSPSKHTLKGKAVPQREKENAKWESYVNFSSVFFEYFPEKVVSPLSPFDLACLLSVNVSIRLF